MLPNHNDPAFLWDMLDAARAVASFVKSRTYRDYLHDRMLRGAVERHLEILGEAAGRVSKPFREHHPEIPWRRIIGLRNVLAHQYRQIRNEEVHRHLMGSASLLREFAASIVAFFEREE